MVRKRQKIHLHQLLIIYRLGHHFLLLYYKFLEFAETKGVSKKPHQTTLEFRNSLQSIFNQNFVKEITDSFNDAFYGAKSFDIDTILKLENQFDQIRFGKTK